MGMHPEVRGRRPRAIAPPSSKGWGTRRLGKAGHAPPHESAGAKRSHKLLIFKHMQCGFMAVMGARRRLDFCC
jgi:hypothetical protein